MKPVLLLLDLQEDYLAAPGLFPARGEIEDHAFRLLAGCRQAGIPVVHAWTTTHDDPDDRMPHWQRLERRWCREGSAGHAPPARLRPLPGEAIVHKTFFSPFQDERLAPLLRRLACDTLWIAGIHTHACVRSAVLDAYQHGFSCQVAADAVASDDPLHAAITRRYLEARAAAFVPVDRLLESAAAPTPSPHAASLPHYAPADQGRCLWHVPIGGAAEVAAAAGAARAAQPALPAQERAQVLQSLGALVRAQSESLARQMTEEVGKPVAQGRIEVVRSVEFIAEAITGYARAGTAGPDGQGRARRRPLGVVAAITPWNNPLAIPLGKLAPALLHGNAVVWKPAPAGTHVALRVMDMLAEAGCPPGLVSLLPGDHVTAQTLLARGEIDAATLSGSLAAGYAAQEICARRHLPLQAELGGNNAAIICPDADLAKAAQAVVAGAFGFAGQRCTANRRVIVIAEVYELFLEALQQAAAALPWGDPGDESTAIGPVISLPACHRLAGFTERAAKAGHRVLRPLGMAPRNARCRSGSFSPPTIVCCDDPAHEIVQEETFGPVLVVQRAAHWEEAMALCNGVRQGLAAALFSHDDARWADFLARARAGMLKRNASTVDVSASLPFGGWRASGVGPPEHGDGDVEFFSRWQSVYGG